MPSMGRIGGTEILLILLIALLIFGPSKLADMGKGLGQGLKNFKKGISQDGNDDEPKPVEPPRPASAEPPKALTAGTPASAGTAASETTEIVNEPPAATPVKPRES
jgi:sec-independent protein translocase protein TatA